MDALRTAVWRHAAGLLRTEELPMIAAVALTQGVDSPTLRELAGLDRRDRADEILLSYGTAMAELGIGIPATQQAVRWLVHELAAALVAGRASAVEVANQLGPGELWMTEAESGLADLAYYRDDFFDLAQPGQMGLFEADMHAAALDVIDEATRER